MKDNILEYKGRIATLYFDLKMGMIKGKSTLGPGIVSNFFSDSLEGIKKKFHEVVDEKIKENASSARQPKRIIKSIYIQPRHSQAFDRLAFEQKGEKTAPELMEEAITLLFEAYEDLEYLKNLDDEQPSTPLEDIVEAAALEDLEEEPEAYDVPSKYKYEEEPEDLTIRHEVKKPLALRFPISLAKDLSKISAITGLSVNAICIELLRPAVKQKLKEVKE